MGHFVQNYQSLQSDDRVLTQAQGPSKGEALPPHQALSPEAALLARNLNNEEPTGLEGDEL